MKLLLLLAAFAAFLGCVGAQAGYSTVYGGLVFNETPEPSPWGNETSPGPLGRVNAPTYVWGAVQSYAVTANVTFTIPLVNSCEFTNSGSWKGKIVFFSLGGFCSHAFKIKAIQDAGGVGAVYGQFSQVPPSWDSMAPDHELAPQLRIGANFVGIDITNYILRQVGIAAKDPNSTFFTATITYQADPLYEWIHSSEFVFVQCLFSIWFGVCAIVSLVKLALFVREQRGVRFSLPQLALSLVFIVSVFEIISITLNVLGSRNNTTQLTQVVFREFFNVLWLVPTLVFPFYWGELVASTQPVIGLKQSRIPFFLAAFIIVAFTLAIDVVKGLYGSSRDAIIAQLCTVCILVGLAAIFFTVQGIRVILSLARMQTGFAATAVQRRTTILFLVLALCMWGFVVSYAAAFAPSIGIAFPDFAAWFLFYYVYAAVAMAIIAGTLSPQAMKEAGVKISAYMSSSAVSGTTSGMASATDVEMERGQLKDKSISDEMIDSQMTDTKVAL